MFSKSTSTWFRWYSSTHILYLIPLVFKYTYTLPDSACTQVQLYSTWFCLYSSTPILYLIPLVLKYTYTLPDFVCTQVHLYSTWFRLFSSTPILYVIPLVLKYTYTLPNSACTLHIHSIYIFSNKFRLDRNWSHVANSNFLILLSLQPGGVNLDIWN